MSTPPVWRSMLFLPAHIEKFVAKAHTRGADAYILDLEDSVPLPQKAHARTVLVQGAQSVSAGGAAALVRVNPDWAWMQLDLDAAVHPQVQAIVLPKVSRADKVQRAAQHIQQLEAQRGMVVGSTWLIAQIEDVDALPHLDEIATSSPRLLGMILGSEDFSVSAGMQPIPEALLMPNQMVQFACRRAGIHPLGFPASIADYDDLDRFVGHIRLAKQMGFVGAFCIHPSQVRVLNEGFSPTEDEILQAQDMVAIYEAALQAGHGAVEYRGKMLDAPVVMRAKNLLTQASTMAAMSLAKDEDVTPLR